MTVYEYETRFHELSCHDIMIFPIKEDKVKCFVRGLRSQLQIESQYMVSAGHSFLDVVDHAWTLVQLLREAYIHLKIILKK